VEVALAGDVKKEEKDDTAAGPTKVLPPWMIREGMALNSKQRGEAKEEDSIEDAAAGPSNMDIKPAEEDKEAMQRKLQVFKSHFTLCSTVHPAYLQSFRVKN
jgi:transcription initiation factor TFIIE subunit alpha